MSPALARPSFSVRSLMAMPVGGNPQSGFSAGSVLLVCLATIPALAGWWFDSPVLLWFAFPAAAWLAFSTPATLVLILAVTTPTFPVIRLADDVVGAKRVSTKGLFFSADDPLITALLIAWVWGLAGRRQSRVPAFPTALLALAILYPLVIAVNSIRLDWAQLTVSALYFLKWLQYAFLCFAVPSLLARSGAGPMVFPVRRAVWCALISSGLFASYESFTAIRTGSYTAAASIPRSSAFFGSLDPTRYGASEDPVNFGVWAMVAGSVALASLGEPGRRASFGAGMGLVSSIASLLLSASRAPWIAAFGAFTRIQRIRSARVLLAAILLSSFALITWAVLPDLWDTTFGRFRVLGEGRDSSEGSALDRIAIAANSPVFQFDQFWLIGHGHSSYRFIAEAHLASITGGVSRSLYNFLLTAWYDVGVVGIVLWGGVFLQLSSRYRSIASSCPDPSVRSLASGLRGALAGLAIASMFGEVPYNWRVMGFFYLLTGVCLAGDAAARRFPTQVLVWLPEGRRP